MTDLTPGSRWLLPVTFKGFMGPFRVGERHAWLTLDSGRVLQAHPLDTATLIPADRITELEAEVKEQRESVARWMFFNSYATGHGDTIDDLLMQLEDQHFERLTKLNDENERLKSELEKLKCP